MNIATWWYHPLLEALGYTVFHALWQGVLLFFPLQAVLFFTKRSKQRYRAQYITFSLLFVAFVITFFIEWQSAAKIQYSHVIGQSLNDAGMASISNPSMLRLSVWERILHIAHDPVLVKAMPFVSLGYVVGILFFALRMIWSFRTLHTLRRQIIPVPGVLQQRFEVLIQVLSIKRKVAVALSEKVNVPMMMGYLKPIVLLPVALMNQLDMEQTEAILIHELSHIKRKDYLFNIIQSVMEIFMFFNPMVWWLSAAIRKEREHCCDDEVLNHTSEPRRYAEALYQLELTRSNLVPALAASGNNNKYTLLTRIKRIVDMKSTQRRTPQGMFTAISICLILIASFCFYTAMAQDKKTSDSVAPTSQKTEKHSSRTVKVIVDDKNEGEAAPDLQAVTQEALDAAGTAMDNINWDEVKQSVKEAKIQMSKIDSDELRHNLEQAKADMAAAKIEMEEAGRSMKDVDFSKVNESMTLALNSLKEIDWNEMGNTINIALQSANIIPDDMLDSVMDNVRIAMKDAKIEMKKAGVQSRKMADSLMVVRKQVYKELSDERKEALATARLKREQAMAKAEEKRTEARAIANAQRAEARANANQMRTIAMANRKSADGRESDNKVTQLLNRLEKEGRIDRNEKYKVTYKDGEMKVNGLMVPASDYQQYLPKGKDASLSVSGKKGSLSISLTE